MQPPKKENLHRYIFKVASFKNNSCMFVIKDKWTSRAQSPWGQGSLLTLRTSSMFTKSALGPIDILHPNPLKSHSRQLRVCMGKTCSIIKLPVVVSYTAGLEVCTPSAPPPYVQVQMLVPFKQHKEPSHCATSWLLQSYQGNEERFPLFIVFFNQVSSHLCNILLSIRPHKAWLQ